MHTSEVKSVTAFLIFFTIVSGESVKQILLFSSGSDLDIFLEGSLKLLILPYSLAEKSFNLHIIWRIFKGHLQVITVWGIGKVSPNLWLKILANSWHSWICCTWSSPTGTWVALQYFHTHPPFLFSFYLTYLYDKISAACKTG